jgi:endonuclease-8
MICIKANMPEGPSIVILKELVQEFKGKKIIGVGGNTKIDKGRMLNQKIIDFKSWGKHFLICFKDFTVRVHFMLFGSYRINEKRIGTPRLSFQFNKGELNFYTCSVQFIDEPLDEVYDWSADVMNNAWDARKARKKLKGNPGMMVCDALLDQHIFAGVGNIIKNEVLFRIKVHPESEVGKLAAKQLNAMIREARNYSFDFLQWKKDFVLRKHWLAYAKKICPRDHVALQKKYLGKTRRRTFFCDKCQVFYG